MTLWHTSFQLVSAFEIEIELSYYHYLQPTNNPPKIVLKQIASVLLAQHHFQNIWMMTSMQDNLKGDLTEKQQNLFSNISFFLNLISYQILKVVEALTHEFQDEQCSLRKRSSCAAPKSLTEILGCLNQESLPGQLQLNIEQLSENNDSWIIITFVFVLKQMVSIWNSCQINHYEKDQKFYSMTYCRANKEMFI